MIRECGLCGNELVVIAAGIDHAIANRCECKSPCSSCNDSKFHFGRDARGYEVAIECECVELDRRVENFNRSGIPSKYHGSTFGNFDAPDPAKRAARHNASRFAAEFVEGERGLIYYGHCGTGKTHLVVAIMRYLLINRGIKVRFIEFMHLLSDLRAAFSDSKPTYGLMNRLTAVPVLAIDELGKGRGSEWEMSVLDELISSRYNAGRTTLFTTNYFVGRGIENQPGLNEKVGERIYSRLMEMCIPQHMSGEDYRRHSSHI